MNSGFPSGEWTYFRFTPCSDCTKRHQTVQVTMANFMSALFSHIEENQMHISEEKAFDFDQILKRLRSPGLVQHFLGVQREGGPWKVTWAEPRHLPTALTEHPAFLCPLIPLKPPSQATHKPCGSTNRKGLPAGLGLQECLSFSP